ncbi:MULTISPECIES: hypothetical protein [unclassified Streptomyces]|uniref:hypothetical protein n=1 Tax=unclassified Streptomyces TaxID=2593676 RepID=UPI002E35D5FD|nr:hypothetical protein [Streptomyces sp. NBC_01724]
MDGRQGAELARRLGPRFALPVHYDDYTVMKSPLSAFLVEMEHRGPGERGHPLRLGPGGDDHTGQPHRACRLKP